MIVSSKLLQLSVKWKLVLTILLMTPDVRTGDWSFICRVGQNRIYTPYMTVYLVISLPKIPYIHRIYMVLANPIHMVLLLFMDCCDKWAAAQSPLSMQH